MFLQPWNSAYRLTELYIQRGLDTFEAQINEDAFLTLQYELYPEGERKDDKSVMVRVENRYFQIRPDSNTPTGVLDLPEEAVEDLRVENTPKKRPVLVVEPWFQDYLSWQKAN